MTSAKNETLESYLERVYCPLLIGDVLKSHRVNRISLANMAKRLKIKEEKLKKIEDNSEIPSLSVVRKASKVLNLSFKVLEGLVERPGKRRRVTGSPSVLLSVGVPVTAKGRSS